MIYWDSSAIIPLCIDEPQTQTVREILKRDGSMVVWWGTTIECHSSIARLRRGDLLTNKEEEQLRTILRIFSDSWTEIKPSQEIFDPEIHFGARQTYPSAFISFRHDGRSFCV